MLPDHDTILSEDPQYILDGGALLHRIPWHTGKSYLEIHNTFLMVVHFCIVFHGIQENLIWRFTIHS